MNAVVKEQWLAALRSGEYKQTTSVLCREGEGFCCMGVLCDLHRKAVGGHWETSENGGLLYQGMISYPPVAVRQWAGLESNVGKQNTKTVSRSDIVVHDIYESSIGLGRLNDGGMSFVQIAEYIERCL